MNNMIYKASSWSKSLIQKCINRENFGVVKYPEPIGSSIIYGRGDGKSSLNIQYKIYRYLIDSKFFKRRLTKYTDYLIKISKR